MANLLVNPQWSDEERRTALFGGALALYAHNQATAALAAHGRKWIIEAFGDLEPQGAQFSLEVSEFVDRVAPLKTSFTNDPSTWELVRAVLDTFGCDLDRTFFDVPRLRVSPHGDYLTSGVSYAYKAHRDTWYSSPGCQINWWMPVYAVVPENTMSFYPAYFSSAVPNSSADFDYDEWCRVNRPAAREQIEKDTRSHPLPKGQFDETSELRIAGGPGDLTMFSAAHLHATAPNTSGVTRFSLDFRTVSLDDLDAGRSAPNVDCEATGTTLGDFLRVSDLAPGLLGASEKGKVGV